MSSSDPSCDVPEDELNRLFITRMVAIYRDAALAQLDEAEAAIARGIELREHAMGLLDRAAKLAGEVDW